MEGVANLPSHAGGEPCPYKGGGGQAAGGERPPERHSRWHHRTHAAEHGEEHGAAAGKHEHGWQTAGAGHAVRD